MSRRSRCARMRAYVNKDANVHWGGIAKQVVPLWLRIAFLQGSLPKVQKNFIYANIFAFCYYLATRPPSMR